MIPEKSKTFESIEWEEASCHLCQGPSKKILLRGKELTQGQFDYEVHPRLCECGLVYLSPRWTPRTYSEFYSEYYDELYRLEIKPDYGSEGVRRHMEQVWLRSKPVLGDISAFKKVIDIGCGSGTGLNVLKEAMPQVQLHGIDASPECLETLEHEVGAIVVDSDLDGDWIEHYEGHFDFIVLRHVVEHILTPIESLSRLKKTLAPVGLMYIAVPDMLNPRIVLRDYENWWEYYFRAVHPYYYSKENLFVTLERAGLYPQVWGEDSEEVWCLVGTEEKKPTQLDGLREKVEKVLAEYLP